MRDPVPAHCFHGHSVVLQLECLETLSHACGRQRRRPGSTNPPPPARFPPGLTTSSPRPRKRTESSGSRRRRVVKRPQEDSGQRHKRRHRYASTMVKHGSETQDGQRGFADSNGSWGLQHSTAQHSTVQCSTVQYDTVPGGRAGEQHCHVYVTWQCSALGQITNFFKKYTETTTTNPITNFFLIRSLTLFLFGHHRNPKHGIGK
jgi:hypothetical protein